jgi:hypothetical protein
VVDSLVPGRRRSNSAVGPFHSLGTPLPYSSDRLDVREPALSSADR